MPISTSTSISLDLLRASAAWAVFLHHCNDLGLDRGMFALFDTGMGHSAVVIFFVLSGYVISATLRPGGTALDYGIKRAARIYSVAIPAVLLTWGLDLLARRLGLPGTSTDYQLAKPWIYLPVALTFTGQIWFLNESAFSNGPYWSLGYEVWYYAIFGIAVFARGSLRWIGLALVLAGVGPKLWALFPIWLGGVAVCRWQQSGIPPRAWARAMVAVSILLLSMVKVFQWEQILNLFAAGIMDATVRMPNGFSNLFLGDYLVGGLVMVLIYGLGGAEFVFPSWPRRLIAGLAHLSFGLYLVHVPLLRFFGGLLPGREWLAILLALGCALGFSALCEPQKDRIRRLVDRSLVAREA